MFDHMTGFCGETYGIGTIVQACDGSDNVRILFQRERQTLPGIVLFDFLIRALIF